MTNINTAFTALSDPTRRAIFERLGQGACSVGALAENLPVSRPAVSQHLGVLRDAGLVTSTAEGTRRVYAIDPDGLGPLREWLDRMWEEGLAVYATEFRPEASKKAS